MTFCDKWNLFSVHDDGKQWKLTMKNDKENIAEFYLITLCRWIKNVWTKKLCKSNILLHGEYPLKSVEYNIPVTNYTWSLKTDNILTSNYLETVFTVIEPWWEEKYLFVSKFSVRILILITCVHIILCQDNHLTSLAPADSIGWQHKNIFRLPSIWSGSTVWGRAVLASPILVCSNMLMSYFFGAIPVREARTES